MSATNPATDSAANALARSQNLYIDGAWRPATGGATIPVLNPSTATMLAWASDATLEDAAAAVEVAAKAAADWAATSPRRCFELMTARSDLIREEIFGPVAALCRFESEDKAISCADDREMAMFSPLLHRHETSTRVTVAFGERKTDPFKSQGVDFAEHLARQGIPATAHMIRNADHMTAVRDLGAAESEAGEFLTRIIRS